MNPTLRLVVHLVALYGGGTVIFDFLPPHWKLIAGATWAGIVAVAAFTDQSLSKQTPQ